VARKNPFATLIDEPKVEAQSPALEYTTRGASRSFISSLDEIAARADKLVEGETVIELDPNDVDPSFVRDRLDVDDAEFQELVTAIRQGEQASPILVRPHPKAAGRYMVVFGHRRLRAAKELRRKVRAVVKQLDDREHVVAQGQENSARANLSFIEKALFAANLSRLKYDEDNATVLSALSIDKTTLSKMLSVASLPQTVLDAIGAAKGIGRDRWYELKILLEPPEAHAHALQIVAQDEFEHLSSDGRFNALLGGLKNLRASTRARSVVGKRSWTPEDGSLSAEMIADGKRFTLALKARGGNAKAFGEYLSENLATFYEAFRQNTQTSTNGD
jgi:ParB family transcriptional regulator, chromosome partitioning protein